MIETRASVCYIVGTHIRYSGCSVVFYVQIRQRDGRVYRILYCLCSGAYGGRALYSVLYNVQYTNLVLTVDQALFPVVPFYSYDCTDYSSAYTFRCAPVIPSR